MLRACLAAALLAGAASGERIGYVIAPDFAAGITRVELTWQLGARTRSALGVSGQWGPIEDVGALIRNVRMNGTNVRDSGTRWEFSHPRDGTLRASYEVDARARAFDDWGLTHHPITTRDFFHGMGNAFLLVPQPGAGTPEEFEVTLRWELPEGCDAVCSWGVGRHVGARVRAADLRGSVYLAGRIETAVTTVAGSRLTVALVDRFPFAPEAFAGWAERIVAAECRFLLEREFPEFVITAVPVGPRLEDGNIRLAGTGMHNSFALFLAPGSALSDAVEHLFAHELLHHWNGRLLGARPPEREVFWFVEGITDYYALRILYESGVWDAATYSKWLNKHLVEYARNPARNATNEQIARDYWRARNTVGEVAYQRGQLLGLRWHALAQQRGVAEGLDALFFKLLARARAGAYEVSNPELRRVGVAELGPWFAEEFDRYVAGAATVEVPPDALAPAILGARRPVYAYDLGFDRARSLAARRVIGLDPDSRAARAGLRAGDELLGWNIYGDTDRECRLQIRRGRLQREIRFLPRGASTTVLQFQPAG